MSFFFDPPFFLDFLSFAEVFFLSFFPDPPFPFLPLPQVKISSKQRGMADNLSGNNSEARVGYARLININPFDSDNRPKELNFFSWTWLPFSPTVLREVILIWILKKGVRQKKLNLPWKLRTWNRSYDRPVYLDKSRDMSYWTVYSKVRATLKKTVQIKSTVVSLKKGHVLN